MWADVGRPWLEQYSVQNRRDPIVAALRLSIEEIARRRAAGMPSCVQN
jgi:hypothetical protein